MADDDWHVDEDRGWEDHHTTVSDDTPAPEPDMTQEETIAALDGDDSSDDDSES